MAKNSVQNIVSKLPVDTELVKYNVGSDGKISAVDVLPITNVVQNDNIAVNILIQAILGCFGIDMPTIATGVATGTHILADMMNLLANAKWDETEITVGDETMSATEYIKKTFGIYSTSDFVNNLFTRLSDITFESESKQDSNIIAFDNEAYQMIKVIARCFGANSNFTKVPIGESTEITYTIDVSDLDDVEDKLALAFKEKGYLADTVDKVYMSNAFKSLLDVNGNVNYNKYFPYMQVLAVKGYPGNPYENSVDTDNPKWCPVFYFTKEPVDDVFFEMGTFTYGSRQGWIWWKPNFKKNGELITQGQEMMKIGANQTNWGYAAIGTLETCYYMNYNGQILNNFEIKNRTDPQATVRVKGYSQNYGDYNDDGWASTFFYNQNNDGQGNPKLEFEWIVWNNEFVTGGQETVPAPVIDTTITDDIDKIDILPINGIFPIIIDWSAVQWIVTPNKTYEDTTTAVKTKLIDISEGVTLDEGIPINDIIEDYEYIYNPYFQSSIDYTGTNGDIFTLLPTEICGVFKGLCEANDFNDVCWDTNFWQSLKGLISDVAKPSDFISKLFALPFSLTGDVEYSVQTNPLIIGGQTFSDARIHKLIKGYKIIKSSHVFIGEETISENGQKKSVKRGTFLDFEPYSNATIYIPFVGDVEIPLNLIMYRYVYLEYTIALISGDFVVTLYSYNYNDKFSSSDDYVSPDKRYKKAYPVVTCTGNMALEFPVCGREYGNASGTVLSIVGGAAAVASGGSTAVAGAIAGGIGAMSNAKPGAFTTGGQMNGILGYLTNWTPYITIFTHEQIAGFNYPVKDSAFNHSIGQRTERGIAIKHMDAGFHKVKGVKLENLKCTNSEKDEIYRILTEGFYTANRVPQPTP